MPTLLQQIIEIKEIKDDVMIMKDGSLRGVLLVSAINFLLKSEEEQNAIIYRFQQFLNSLEFPIEILIQSRKINLSPYIEKLKELEEKQENELLKVQTKDYREFIEKLSASEEIMTKSCFVIVPFYPLPLVLGKKKTEEEFQPFEEIKFKEWRNQLFQRMEFVAMGLKGCGLECGYLSTEELIDLFWSLYHPDEAEVGYHPLVPPELLK